MIPATPDPLHLENGHDGGEQSQQHKLPDAQAREDETVTTRW